MASGTIKAGVTPISEGGTGSIDWQSALLNLGSFPDTAQLQNTTLNSDVDNATLPLIRVRTNASYNSQLSNLLGTSFAYILQFFYSAEPGNQTATATRIQIALPYDKSTNKIAWRTYANGWGSWHVLTGS